jgi:hypothetical protein
MKRGLIIILAFGFVGEVHGAPTDSGVCPYRCTNDEFLDCTTDADCNKYTTKSDTETTSKGTRYRSCQVLTSSGVCQQRQNTTGAPCMMV